MYVECIWEVNTGLCSPKLPFSSESDAILPLCVQAAHSSNVSASICLAQVDDARGDMRSALKYWARAAKLGHPEAQFRLGRVRLRSVYYLTQVCKCPGIQARYE